MRPTSDPRMGLDSDERIARMQLAARDSCIAQLEAELAARDAALAAAHEALRRLTALYESEHDPIEAVGMRRPQWLADALAATAPRAATEELRLLRELWQVTEHPPEKGRDMWDVLANLRRFREERGEGRFGR